VVVFRDGGGAVIGFNCFLVLRPEERAWSEADPAAAAIWHYLDTQPPLDEGQFVAVARFWMDKDAYQDVSPAQGMIFVSAIRYMITTPGLAYTFHVWAKADLWIPAARQVLFHRLPEADFMVGERQFGMYLRDWRAQPPAAWLDALAERETE